MGTDLPCTLPHVFHVGIGHLRVNCGQRMVKLPRWINTQEQHQGFVSKSIKNKSRQVIDRAGQEPHPATSGVTRLLTSLPLLPHRLAYLSHVLMSS